jgi:hypothetical protein
MHVQSRKQQIELVVTQENDFDKEAVSFLFVFRQRRLWVRKHRCFLEGGNGRACVVTKKKKKKQALV